MRQSEHLHQPVMESEHPGELRLQDLWYFATVVGKGAQEVSVVKTGAALVNVSNPRAQNMQQVSPGTTLWP